MQKQKVLQSLLPQFINQSSENEGDQLQSYFIETDAWHQLIAGYVHVIMGSKGAGKSALYALLLQKQETFLRDKRIFITKAEEPLGASAFLEALGQRLREASKSSSINPLISEQEFIHIWKWYFLSLIGMVFSQQTVNHSHLEKNQSSIELINELRHWGIISNRKSSNIGQMLQNVMKFIPLRFELNLSAIQTRMQLGNTDNLEDLQAEQQIRKESSVTDLYDLAQQALSQCDLRIWLVIDRLDEAFASLPNQAGDLEKNALRGLMRTFNDLLGWDRIRLKVFVRHDLFQRIFEARRFPNADKINPRIELQWRPEQLLDLVMRRVLLCEETKEFYDITQNDIDQMLANYQMQEACYYRIFPSLIDEVPAFSWSINSLMDGMDQVAPRDLIRFIYHAISIQLARRVDAKGEALFDITTIKEASKKASQDHYQTTFLAEYPHLYDYVENLRRRRVQLNFIRLCECWRIKNKNEDKARKIISELIATGFLRREDPHIGNDVYSISPLYQAALEIQPGSEI